MGQLIGKREIAKAFGVTIAEVTKWVNDGCPCESSGKIRSALLFSPPAVFRWWLLYRTRNQCPEALPVMEREIRIMDLERQLEEARHGLPTR